jgi:hypothetical protein
MQNEHEKYVRQAIGFTNEYGEPKPVLPEHIVKTIELAEKMLEKAGKQPNFSKESIVVLVAVSVMQNGGTLPVKPAWDSEAEERRRKAAAEASGQTKHPPVPAKPALISGK